MDFRKKFQIDFQHFCLCRKGSIVGAEGPNDAAEGCSPLQEIEKATRRAAIFLVILFQKRCYSVLSPFYDSLLSRHPVYLCSSSSLQFDAQQLTIKKIPSPVLLLLLLPLGTLAVPFS